MGTKATCFHRVGKICCDKMRLKINLRTGIKLSEQPLLIIAGIPSNPTDFDERRRLIALRTSESETDATGTESDDRKSV
jgi:hypothetical protein